MYYGKKRQRRVVYGPYTVPFYCDGQEIRDVMLMRETFVVTAPYLPW